MGKIDKEKESIGYLKVIFSILIAIDVSLVAWAFKNYMIMSDIKNIIIFLLIGLITFAIILVNRKILKKIDYLEEL